MKNKYRNGLVLGGGGSKGFAHIGAIIEMEEQSLRPDIICGTSAGALAGAFYAVHGEKITEFRKIEDTREFKILKELKLGNIDFQEEKQGLFIKTVNTVKAKFSMIKMLMDTAVLKKEEIVPVFRNLFGNTQFGDTGIPFISAAFDIVSGRDVYIKSGPLWKGVMASCSIPGIFPPVEYNDMILVDGGVTCRFPVKCAVLSGAGNIVGIDLSGTLNFEKEINSVVDLHLRIDALLTNRFDIYNKIMADLVIKPDLGNMRWDEFGRYSYAMEKGRDSVKQKLSEIREVRSRYYGYKKNILSLLGNFEQKKLRMIDKEEYLFV
ncbi:MAG TPA: patatin-like phospholipase family protein [bacterium]|nr:patatin-like phospholipase family protein [bacterium]